MIRFGLQLPSFTFPGLQDDGLFDRVTEIASAAEDSGFDSFFVMDHFQQIANIGPPEHPMFEAYTLLGALAARTSRVKLGALVTGVTYRNPALLAKIVTTLDVLSRGRAILGIGSAWNDKEAREYGYDWPSTRERMERLEDAIQICRAMFTQKVATFEGRHHHIRGALNFPRPVQPGGPKIMVGAAESSARSAWSRSTRTRATCSATSTPSATSSRSSRGTAATSDAIRPRSRRPGWGRWSSPTRRRRPRPGWRSAGRRASTPSGSGRTWSAIPRPFATRYRPTSMRASTG